MRVTGFGDATVVSSFSSSRYSPVAAALPALMASEKLKVSVSYTTCVSVCSPWKST